MKIHDNCAAEYGTYLLDKRSTRHDDTVSSYTTDMVKKIKWQIKAHFFDLNDLISIIGFLATFKLVGVKDCIHKEAAMHVLSSNVINKLSSTLNSRMSVATNIAPITASVH